MTTEQQNIAIAELCGLRVEYHMTNPPRAFGIVKQIGGLVFAEPIPSYTSDLNACHEMEKSLAGCNNWEICDYVQRVHAMTIGWPAFATAAQRAEAFLRVHGKWEDGK